MVGVSCAQQHSRSRRRRSLPHQVFNGNTASCAVVADARTPLGKVSEGDDREPPRISCHLGCIFLKMAPISLRLGNFWTILVDTDNFAGPLAYFIPEFWSERWDSPNPSPGSAAIGDLGKAGHGLSMGGGAFECERHSEDLS